MITIIVKTGKMAFIAEEDLHWQPLNEHKNHHYHLNVSSSFPLSYIIMFLILKNTFYNCDIDHEIIL